VNNSTIQKNAVFAYNISIKGKVGEDCVGLYPYVGNNAEKEYFTIQSSEGWS
jgi:hypothetical protein